MMLRKIGASQAGIEHLMKHLACSINAHFHRFDRTTQSCCDLGLAHLLDGK